jgi:hypothetical protein
VGVTEILVQIDRDLALLNQARALLTGNTVVAASQKKAAAHSAKKPATKKTAAKQPAKKTRNLSPEGRKRIAEAVKRRWAAQKKAKAAPGK